jgi:shikimate kinase
MAKRGKTEYPIKMVETVDDIPADEAGDLETEQSVSADARNLTPEETLVGLVILKLKRTRGNQHVFISDLTGGGMVCVETMSRPVAHHEACVEFIKCGYAQNQRRTDHGTSRPMVQNTIELTADGRRAVQQSIPYAIEEIVARITDTQSRIDERVEKKDKRSANAFEDSIKKLESLKKKIVDLASEMGIAVKQG